MDRSSSRLTLKNGFLRTLAMRVDYNSKQLVKVFANGLKVTLAVLISSAFFVRPVHATPTPVPAPSLVNYERLAKVPARVFFLELLKDMNGYESRIWLHAISRMSCGQGLMRTPDVELERILAAILDVSQKNGGGINGYQLNALASSYSLYFCGQ